MTSTFVKILSRYVDYLKSQDPLLSQIPVARGIHQGIVRYEAQGQELRTPAYGATAEFAFSVEEMTTLDIEKLSVVIYENAMSIIEQMKKSIYAALGDVSDFHGQTIDARGQGFSHDLLLDAWERMPALLDEKWEIVRPNLHVSPQLAEVIRNTPMTEKQSARAKSIEDSKRKEVIAKKRNRRLPRIRL